MGAQLHEQNIARFDYLIYFWEGSRNMTEMSIKNFSWKLNKEKKNRDVWSTTLKIFANICCHIFLSHFSFTLMQICNCNC